MTEAKQCSLAAVLMVTTAKCLLKDTAPLAELMHHLWGQPVPVSIAPLAAFEARMELFRQLPFLANIHPDYVIGQWEEWLEQQEQKYGKTVSVSPMPSEKKLELTGWITAMPEGERLIVLGEKGIGRADENNQGEG